MKENHLEFFDKLKELCKNYNTSISTSLYYSQEELDLIEAASCNFKDDNVKYCDFFIDSTKVKYETTEDYKIDKSKIITQDEIKSRILDCMIHYETSDGTKFIKNPINNKAFAQAYCYELDLLRKEKGII